LAYAKPWVPSQHSRTNKTEASSLPFSWHFSASYLYPGVNSQANFSLLPAFSDLGSKYWLLYFYRVGE
jgi:hypothetical protein